MKGLFDYTLMFDKIRGYEFALSQLFNIGYRASDGLAHYHDEEIRYGLRIARFSVSKGIRFDDLETEIRNMEFSDSFPLEAVTAAYPVYTKIIHCNFPKRSRMIADIGIYSAYLDGRGLAFDWYEKEMAEKWTNAQEFAELVMMEINEIRMNVRRQKPSDN
ncbi:MAG: hypothetical protein NDI94_06680 [Candidatus Woesearchaeota archaeon]|nr:hypothetical protein [Candidatus Woesearchaeota archaeon]